MDAKMKRNLLDAGCSEEFVEDFGRAASDEERLRRLARYRVKLLDSIHVEQRKLDCLDYLIYQMKQEEKQTRC